MTHTDKRFTIADKPEGKISEMFWRPKGEKMKKKMLKKTVCENFKTCGSNGPNKPGHDCGLRVVPCSVTPYCVKCRRSGYALA